MKHSLRLGAWSVAAALVVLCARSLAYALSPSPLAAHFEGKAGGPHLPVVALVSLSLALGLSSGIVWLAALGVRERRLLERRPVPAPRLRLARLAVRALVLFAASLAFALLESFVHWRAGLGWHGLYCLVGPAHRDAVPLLGGLSLIAAAVGAALEHVLAWMRRTIARLLARPPALRPVPRVRPASPSLLPGRVAFATPGARAPPILVF